MKMLAFDFGASSGRGIIGELNDGIINIKEVHRFSNQPVQFNQHLQWDFLRLLHEVKQCFIQCKKNGDKIESVGIDTWGVDYGLIDHNGELLTSPHHYRDTRTEPMLEKCFGVISKEELIETSGIDCLPYNTIYQLLAEMELAPERLRIAKTMLLMPDLFNYALTGEKKAEYTIATTTQLYDYKNNDWNYAIINRIGLPKEIFPPIVHPGEIVGELKDEIAKELNIDKCKIVSVGSHDTSSAIAAVPADEEEFVFIATGTWIMVGIENNRLIVNDKTVQYGLSNEGGVGGKVNLLRNVMGLWLLQECKRQWNKEGIEIGFGDMVKEGARTSISSVINPDDPSFYTPGDMPNKIKDYCKNTGQYVPKTIGEIVRVVEDSLALRIRYIINGLEEVLSKQLGVIHMFGGGIQDQLLCQITANATGKKVITGPKEATAIGNILLQAIALGEIKNIKEARNIVRNSIDMRTYEPEGMVELDGKYSKFLEIIQ